MAVFKVIIDCISMAWRQKTQQLTKLTILITLKTGDQQKSIKIKKVINKLKFDSRNQN